MAEAKYSGISRRSDARLWDTRRAAAPVRFHQMDAFKFYRARFLHPLVASNLGQVKGEGPDEQVRNVSAQTLSV